MCVAKPEEESRRRESGRPPPYSPGPFALIYAGLLLAGLAAAAVVYAVLVSAVPGMASNRTDTMKTALLVIGGSGALAALYVSYRKQRNDEANHVRDQDKLFTERYTAAAAQLGNEAAAIRLAGVYALARIADDSERDRSTCLNVLCGYLRMMPYDPDGPEANKSEREIRITAQTAITDRLRPDHPGFWPYAHINITDAYLIDPDFSRIAVGEFTANRATFSGDAKFDGATFGGDVEFYGATFGEDALFGEARFGGHARFSRAGFGGNARFQMATFSRDAWFNEARFSGNAWFNVATFSGNAGFDEATFSGVAGFKGATFSGDAGFKAATFGGDAWFEVATFGGYAWFDGARFRRDRPRVWPYRFGEPAGIVWVDPLAPAPDPNDPDPDPPADSADPPESP